MFVNNTGELKLIKVMVTLINPLMCGLRGNKYDRKMYFCNFLLQMIVIILCRFQVVGFWPVLARALVRAYFSPLRVKKIKV